jgi:RHS repeat-associated protein
VKRVLAKNNEVSQWSLRQERRFLYDGWNMIAESSRGTEARWTDGTADCPGGVRARAEHLNQLDVPSNGQARLHRSYAWGLDASGTLTGAGGVGGLLLTSHHTPQADGGTQVTTLAPLYDFNGNVLAYADVATSTITHRMEYDPFGQELSLDTLLPGEGAAEAPRFRFSTKYTDGETGLVYYGFRYYSPELGRWVNRDPIEERGGVNLYGMVGNDVINNGDINGKSGWQFTDAFGRPLPGTPGHPDYLPPNIFLPSLEDVQTCLDVAGLIPGLGEFADGVNAAISAANGDWTNAALSVGAMVPFVGWGSSGAKFGKKCCSGPTTTAKQAEEMALCNAIYLANFNVCNQLHTLAARKKCHEDILKQLTDCLAEAKP